MNDFKEIHSSKSGLNTCNQCFQVMLSPQVYTVLKACIDLKLGSSLVDFECHFNESLEKKM
ncbi:hypothetical protein ACSBR1_019038 [Camellia fascicularis]